MEGKSWMDNLAEQNYDCYALDFLGYGYSDRYPEMLNKYLEGKPPGRAIAVFQDIDSAVNYIVKKPAAKRLILLPISWGGSVAALYATKFPDKIENLVLFPPQTAGKSKSDAELIDYSYRQ
jgi:pimeloyl-ACP methyl ester carboxylesterase